MLHTETVEPGTLALIQRLSADPALKDFALVGGTALALQLGHRISVDIDMFSSTAFDSKALQAHLEQEYKAEWIGISPHTVQGMVENIKTMFLAHRYPWVDPVEEIDGVRMASPREIGAMKLNAIVNSHGKRLKDFADLHVLLEHHNLESILDAFGRKYPDSRSEAAEVALGHYKNTIPSRIDVPGRNFSGGDVANRLREALRDPQKVFIPIKLGRSVGFDPNFDRDRRRGRKR